jgi:energy-coupling factor transporter ATP-binding protein EcfA2
VTVVLTEHKLEWVAQFADRTIVLSEGKVIADGVPREVLSSGALEGLGLRPTRYTLAARGVVQAGLAPGREGASLPVTLDQATEFLQWK